MVVSLGQAIPLKKKLTLCMWGARTTATWKQAWFLFLIFYLCTYSCINFMRPKHSAYFLIKFTTDWWWAGDGEFLTPTPKKIGLGLSLNKLPEGGGSKDFPEWFNKGRSSQQFFLPAKLLYRTPEWDFHQWDFLKVQTNDLSRVIRTNHKVCAPNNPLVNKLLTSL